VLARVSGQRSGFGVGPAPFPIHFHDGRPFGAGFAGWTFRPTFGEAGHDSGHLAVYLVHC
jgi:hypothetical protein